METPSSIHKRRNNVRPIDQFFIPVPKKICLPTPPDPETSSPMPNTSSNLITNLEYSSDYDTSTSKTVNERKCLGEHEPDAVQKNSSVIIKATIVYDIGKYAGQKIDDFTKRELLLNPWIPPKNYTFPYSTHNKKGKDEKRYASQKHLDNFDWLVFSDVSKGFYCKYCPFFVNSGVGGYRKNVPLNRLVTQPLNTFAKLYGKNGALDIHDKCEYHKHAVQAAKDFLRSEKNPELSMINRLNSERLKQIEENRLRLKPILETVIFLARQNIAFRGYRDDGPLTYDSPVNEGNFRELLRFRIKSGDNQLKKHLEQSSSRATYISKTTQNNLIDCCGEEILSIIIKRVQDAGVYSIMFDETTDISHISQLTLVLRYIHETKIREDFIQFLDLHKEISNATSSSTNVPELTITGSKLGKTVVYILEKLNLDLKRCVGISTDGCSVMISETRGAVAEVKKAAINAVYSPCHNHILNLSISRSSQVQAVRNAVGTMKEIIAFFTASAKRSHIVKKVIGHQLSGLCETRWVERHDGVLQFRISLPKIIETLGHIATWNDIQTSSKANTLRTALCDSEFLVSVVCLSDVLSCTVSLSRYFQKTQIDLKTAQDILKDTLVIMDSKRKNCEANFVTLYTEISSIAESLGTEIRIPRITKRQANRENYPTSNFVDFYRQSIYVPIIENVIEDLKHRFSKETLDIYNLSVLFPDCLDNEMSNTCENVRKIAVKYHTFFNKPEDMVEKVLVNELQLWKVKWEREKTNYSTIPATATELLIFCDSDVYPTIHVLLKILISLPVSVASAERSFSTLRRLKTWLRSTMTEDRLLGLALLHVHYDVDLDYDRIIDRFAKSKKHRLEFIL